MKWYTISNIRDIDSPALVLYPHRIQDNITAAINMVDHVSALRPHVKTSKISQVAQMLMQAGITKFKCATIAEAEMLALVAAQDVLLAYQPVGPKILRLLDLARAYPATRFSCLVDSLENAERLNEACAAQESTLAVFIDLNVGMGRTGIMPEHASGLLEAIGKLPGLHTVGLHAYDGHLHDRELAVLCQKSDQAFARVETLAAQMLSRTGKPPTLVAGGSPTLPCHAKRKGVECSPGTFVFWDWGYQHQFPDLPFQYAALVIARVISMLDEHTICLDLGHKSVAAENPLPRVHFLNAPGAVPVAQSEEHLVVEVEDAHSWKIGDVWYGVPVHICPTVALYEKAHIVEEGCMTGEWRVIARDRSIHY